MAKKNLGSGEGKSPAIISESIIRERIYMIRGQKVMLDADLAEIYGYTTSAFNQQVKNNIKKFEGEDFMFQPTRDELNVLIKDSCRFSSDKGCAAESKKMVSRNKHLTEQENLKSKNLISSWGGARTLPYAFTEQGVYMLMTVLRGDLATRQSRALIRMFKRMKDYILDNQENLEYRSNLQLAAKEISNLQYAEKINSDIIRIDNQIYDINAKLNNTITKSEIAPILLDFKNGIAQKEFVIMGGELLKASETYIDLYASAKKSIYLIDNYISIKTLRHFCKVRNGVKIIVFSDNLGHYLHKNDYEDFRKEFPHISLRFIRTEDIVHDRFIVIDYGEKNEKIYHCGASEKDAGRKLTTISTSNDALVGSVMHEVIEGLKNNRGLLL